MDSKDWSKSRLPRSPARSAQQPKRMKHKQSQAAVARAAQLLRPRPHRALLDPLPPSLARQNRNLAARELDADKSYLMKQEEISIMFAHRLASSASLIFSSLTEHHQKPCSGDLKSWFRTATTCFFPIIYVGSPTSSDR